MSSGPDPLRTSVEAGGTPHGNNLKVRSGSSLHFPLTKPTVKCCRILNFPYQTQLQTDTSFLYLWGIEGKGQLYIFNWTIQSETLNPKLIKPNLKSRGPTNKEMRSYNGNIKMLHINKGNSHFSTKGDLVYDLLTQQKALIISITKSNARTKPEASRVDPPNTSSAE